LLALQCVPSPYTFSDDDPSSTREAESRDPQSTGICFLVLAEIKERPKEQRLQFELQLRRSVYIFDTDIDSDTGTDTYSTTRSSETEWVTINTSTLFDERKSTSPWRSVSYFDMEPAPPYNSLSALAFKQICRSTAPECLSSRSSHRHKDAAQILTHHRAPGYSNVDTDTDTP
jgi:hypothetical protein